MNSISLLVVSFITSASLVLADGIPVDRKTGKVEVPHTVVALTEEQVEETQTLGTLTLTQGQWRDIRQKSPQCPKRFSDVVPVKWNDCTCGLEQGYVIALSRDRVAVLHDETSGVSVQKLCYELFEYSNITLRMNERGEFYLGGRLIPFPMLLEALVTPPDDAGGKKGRYLDLELPVGSKQTDAVFESRLREVAAAADKMGLSHRLFPQVDNATHN
ncbi:MAG: hypothetical protein V4819_06325 [Verrucomicrobiota bacterium]